MATQYLYPARFDAGVIDWFVYFEDYPVVKTSFNINTFGEPRVAEVLSLYADEYVNTSEIQPVGVTSSITLIADPLENQNTFNEHSIALIVNLVAQILSNQNTFNEATVEPGTIDLQPEELSNSNTFNSITLNGIYRISVEKYTNLNTFGEDIIDVGAVNLTPSRYVNNNTFYVASRQSSYSASAELFENQSEFYSYNAIRLLVPIKIASTNSFYVAELTVGSVDVEPNIFNNINTFNTSRIYETYYDFAPRKGHANVNVQARSNIATTSRRPNLSRARR